MYRASNDTTCGLPLILLSIVLSVFLCAGDAFALKKPKLDNTGRLIEAIRDKGILETVPEELFINTLEIMRELDAPDIVVAKDGEALVISCGEKSHKIKPDRLGWERYDRNFRDSFPVVHACASDPEALAPGKFDELVMKRTLSALHVRSVLYTPEARKDLSQRGESFTGVGIQIMKHEKGIKVIAPIAGSPGWKAGIMPGDIIVSVKGVPIKGKDLLETVSMIRGERGSTVRLSIEREGQGQEQVSVVRDVITFPAVMHNVDSHGRGYVKIALFSEPAREAFLNAINDLNSSGARGLILDLRDNPGGQPLPARTAITYLTGGAEGPMTMHGRQGQERIPIPEGSKLFTGHIVVLVNEGTYGDSLFMTEALRKSARALFVGKRTEPMPLSFEHVELEGEYLASIPARRYSGLSFYDGFQPDIEVPRGPGPEDAQLEAALALLDMALEGGTLTSALDSYRATLSEDATGKEFSSALALGTMEPLEGFVLKHRHSRNTGEAMRRLAGLASASGERKRVSVLLERYPGLAGELPAEEQILYVGPSNLKVFKAAELLAMGMGEDVLATKIEQAAKPYKDFELDELMWLKGHGLTDRVVMAMMTATQDASAQEEDMRERRELETLRMEIEQLKGRLDQAEKAPAPAASSSAPVPSAGSTITNCAARLAALEACSHAPGLTRPICEIAAKAKFPCN